MEELLYSLVAGVSGPLAYLLIFTILVICGLGVPLPEDISLILGGWLAYKGAAHLPVMMAVGFLGILVGDSLIFMAGRRIGTRVGRGERGGFFSRIVTPEKRAKVEGLFAKHGQKVVMIARFAPGVRAVTYFTAGSAGMSYWRFIFWDGVAALASAPLFVWLGYYFGGQLEWLTDKLKEGQTVVIGALLVLVAGYFVYSRRKAAASRAQASQAALPAATSLELAADAANADPAAPAKLYGVAEDAAGSRAELRK